jgi:hypothetical protein
MLNRIIEKARQQEIFSREDTPTERRVLGSFLYHAGLSLREIESVVGCCYEAIRDWFHRCKHLFEPDCQAHHHEGGDRYRARMWHRFGKPDQLL